MENRLVWQHVTQYNNIIPIWTDWLTVTNDHSFIAVKPRRNRLMLLPAAQTWRQPCISVIAMRLLSPFILANCDFLVNCFMIHWCVVSRKLYICGLTVPKASKLCTVCVTSFHLLYLLFNLHSVTLNWAGISLLHYCYLGVWPDTLIKWLAHHMVIVPEHAGGPNRICSLHRNASVMISWPSLLIIHYDKIMKTVKYYMWYAQFTKKRHIKLQILSLCIFCSVKMWLFEGVLAKIAAVN